MKASLLAWAASALLLTILAGGVGTTGFAQTTAAPATPPATSAPEAAPSAGTSPGTTSSSTTATGHHAAPSHARSATSGAPGPIMEQMAERRITELHARLHITPQQQAQWDQFAQVMRDNGKDLDQAYQQRAAATGSMNAVENMQSYALIEQTRAQDVQKLVPAFQAVYSALSDEQKQQADELFRNQAVRAATHHAKAAAH
jgi:protein CpxP